MSGVTKHIFEDDIRHILSMWATQLKSICKVLPHNYTKEDIIEALKTYFPHEWFSVEMKHLYYARKDKYLSRRFGEKRFNMEPAEQLIERSNVYKAIISHRYKENYSRRFSEELIAKAKQSLWAKRMPKIQRINEKISHAKSKVQQVTPAYLNQLIGLYERKTTLQKDRVYILAELKKYYSLEIILFFYKLVDTELNKQLRWEAFYHLQSFNFQPRARRQKYMQVHSSSKTRREYLRHTYPNERYSIVHSPEELDYRINNAKEQKMKSYDFFISHSYRDGPLVQRLIEHENQNGKNVFCDWINDSDYLKRHLLCEATLRVIEQRLEQSQALLFVQSTHSMNSVWCKYELNYFHKLGRPIYTVSIDSISRGEFSVQLDVGDWYIDPNYRNLVHFESKKLIGGLTSSENDF